MGIKPKVHYKKGHPCEEIAGLFEKKVSSFINSLSIDSSIHSELSTRG